MMEQIWVSLRKPTLPLVLVQYQGFLSQQIFQWQAEALAIDNPNLGTSITVASVGHGLRNGFLDKIEGATGYKTDDNSYKWMRMGQCVIG